MAEQDLKLHIATTADDTALTKTAAGLKSVDVVADAPWRVSGSSKTEAL